MNAGVLNDGEVNGSPNWLPSQNPSIPPGVVVAVDIDVWYQFLVVESTSVEAVVQALKTAVLLAIASAEGSITVAAVQNAAESVAGVLAINSVAFDGDSTVASVPTPTYCAPQYIGVSIRTIR